MTTEEIVESRSDHTTPRRRSPRGAAPVGAVLTMAIGLWLGLGHMVLGYPLTAVTRDTIYRAEGIAILVFLLGFYLHFHPGSPVASTLCVALGVLVVASGLWLPHETDESQINELVTGVLLVAVALTAGAGRTRHPSGPRQP